ncbi:MAG: beta-galactosidase [Pseudomonadota bacterium]|nr:beta-galactosidase [Pseudomonadota bacterium]
MRMYGRVLWRCAAAVLLCAAAAVCGDEIAGTAAHSLQLGAPRAEADYFPLGIVRGDPAPAIAAGFSQVQEAVQARDFAAGKPYPVPSPYQNDARGLRYFSLALAADSLPGARNALDLFDPQLQPYLESYGRAHVQSRVRSPIDASVQFWGLDNEWEPPLSLPPSAHEPFVDWLRETYAGDISALNEAWSTQFSNFDSNIVEPVNDENAWRERPGAFLDWYAFSSEHFLQLLVAQAKAMHEADPRRRGVVHKSTQLTLERPMTSRTRVFDHARFAELMRPYSHGYYGIDMYGAGDRQAYETSYVYNSFRPQDGARGYGVLLTETNNHGGAGHQFASTFWRLLANGAKGMMFFTHGNAAAPRTSDWNRYAMRDPDTGRYSERWFYAARLAAAIHRTESFWTQAVPARVPKVAMLLPQRDVLLAEKSERNAAEGRFAYARNERWLVYRWLREQGYWVDVLPYAKLDALRDYEALLLVGAEHLREEESEAVLAFVEDGGVLVADTMPGYFDEHHRVRNPLAKAFGLDVTRHEAAQRMRIEIGSTAVTGMTRHEVLSPAAQVLARDADGATRALLQKHGNGMLLLLPFELGSLQPGRPRAADDDGGSGAWFAGLLQEAGVMPAYVAHYAAGDDMRDARADDSAHVLRVEQPYVDREGNLALVVATRGAARQETVPVGQVELILPEGSWTQAWWASAENAELMPIAVNALDDGRYRIALPEVASAGILYFFTQSAPLLGIETESETRVQAGDAFTLSVQVVNASRHARDAGELRIDAPAGWLVSPATVVTPKLDAGAMHTQRFTITPPERLTHDYPQPLVARFNDGERDSAVTSTSIDVAVDPAQRSLLLTGNASWSRDYPHRRDARVTYRHLEPADDEFDDPASLQGTGGALLNGFGSVGGERDSMNRGAWVRSHYVHYRAREAWILFDLRSVRQIERVHVVKGPEHVTPLSVETYTSVDGENYARQNTLAFTVPALESVIAMHRIEARYVKLRVIWPSAGGTLDEVEIWGR